MAAVAKGEPWALLFLFLLGNFSARARAVVVQICTRCRPHCSTMQTLWRRRHGASRPLLRRVSVDESGGVQFGALPLNARQWVGVWAHAQSRSSSALASAIAEAAPRPPVLQARVVSDVVESGVCTDGCPSTACPRLTSRAPRRSTCAHGGSGERRAGGEGGKGAAAAPPGGGAGAGAVVVDVAHAWSHTAREQAERSEVMAATLARVEARRATAAADIAAQVRSGGRARATV
jgi:hypothetical protein